MAWSADQDAVLLLCHGPKAGHVCWLGGPEDVWDDIVSMNTINQPGSIVVYEPAGHLGPLPGVLAIVFLYTSGKRQVIQGYHLDPAGLHHSCETWKKAWTNNGQCQWQRCWEGSSPTW